MKILYFGILSEITGKSHEELSFEGTVSDLKELIGNQYPDIKKHDFQVAVDQNIASEDQSISTAVEIALLPPFTGG